MRVRGYPSIGDEKVLLDEGLDKNMRSINSNIEKEIIVEALRNCKYNKTETAKLLKISRKTLFNKIKVYGI